MGLGLGFGLGFGLSRDEDPSAVARRPAASAVSCSMRPRIQSTTCEAA